MITIIIDLILLILIIKKLDFELLFQEISSELHNRFLSGCNPTEYFNRYRNRCTCHRSFTINRRLRFNMTNIPGLYRPYEPENFLDYDCDLTDLPELIGSNGPEKFRDYDDGLTEVPELIGCD